MKVSTRVLLHLFFWGFIVFMPQLAFHYFRKADSDYNWLLFANAINIVYFYLAYFAILGPILKGKKIVLFIIFGILLILIFSYFRLKLTQYIGLKFDLGFIKKHYSDKLIIREILNTAVFSGYVVFMKFTEDWFVDQKLKAQLINQNQSSELALLKSQVNPHFLFNTLNNIYSLVYKKSPDAPTAVMKLSEIMRYMLYDTNVEKVPLTKEIEYLKSFIDLQRLRTKYEELVHLEISGDVDSIYVPPMLLIPFVENAFKHGSKKQNTPIIISLDCAEDTLNFTVSNPLGHESIQQKDTTGGIGLQNVKRRLELLYPDRHNLSIEQSTNMFSITLVLNLYPNR